MSSISSLMRQFDKALAASNAPVEIAAMSPTFFAQIKSTTALAGPVSTQMCVVGYARRSSKNEGSDSIDRQRRALEEYSHRKFGRPLDDFYSDTSITGQTWKRPGLQKLMQDASRGMITHVIIEDVDRLARKLHIAAEFKDRCDNWKVKIHSTFKGGEVDSSDVAIRGFLSADVIEKMKIRSMEGRRKRAENGGAVFSMPFGYVRASSMRGDWKVDESKRKLIESLYDACIDGVDLHTLVRVINAREIVEKSGEGKWTRERMKDLLSNPKYMGLSVYGAVTRRFDSDKSKVVCLDNPMENWIFAEVPQWAIVSKAKWHAAHATLKRPAKRVLKRPHLLLHSQQAFCSNCGNRISTRRYARSTSRWELRCVNQACRERMGHPVAMVENEMLKAVRTILSDPQYEAAFEAKLTTTHDRICVELAEQRSALEDRIRMLDQKLDVLLDETVELRAKKRDDVEGERDEFHALGADRIHRRISQLKAELRIAEQEHSMLPSAPQKLDRANRARLLAAFDYLIELRASGDSRPAIETEELIMAEAAVSNLIEKVIIGTVFPGRTARIEVVIRLEAIFGDIVKVLGDSRRSLVAFVHQPFPSQTREGYLEVEACTAWANRHMAATDDQFAAVEHLIDEHMRKGLARRGLSARDLVDLVFLTTRANILPTFLRIPNGDDSIAINKIFGRIWLSSEGLAKKMSTIIAGRFPDLFQEMNIAGFVAYFAARKVKNQEIRKKYGR